jgi:holo-[acyl-carrier-protein] synthase
MTPTGEHRYVTVVARVPVARIVHLRQRFADRFLGRCFSASERVYCLRRRRPDTSLAARWAARVAVRCALRAFDRDAPVRPGEASVEPDARGAPKLRLLGPLADGLPAAALSLAHDGGEAVAALVVRLEQP